MIGLLGIGVGASVAVTVSIGAGALIPAPFCTREHVISAATVRACAGPLRHGKVRFGTDRLRAAVVCVGASELTGTAVSVI